MQTCLPNPGLPNPALPHRRRPSMALILQSLPPQPSTPAQVVPGEDAVEEFSDMEDADDDADDEDEDEEAAPTRPTRRAHRPAEDGMEAGRKGGGGMGGVVRLSAVGLRRACWALAEGRALRAGAAAGVWVMGYTWGGTDYS